ncbi:MAG: futalosine hydrolase [Planctomycetota bacterium]
MRTLVLVPTAFEREKLERELRALGADGQEIATCGFGPIAAAARTQHLVRTASPERVVLVGIAGTFDRDAFPIGTATAFARATCTGVGAHGARGFLGPRELGFAQLDADEHGRAVFDEVALARPEGLPCLDVVLCAPTASADPAEARSRAALEPPPAAEDMESFAAAIAARLSGVPCAVLRGASNDVGDRDVRSWRVDEAIASVARLLRDALGATWNTNPEAER